MLELTPREADADDADIAAWYSFGPGVTLRANMIMTADGVAAGPDGMTRSLSGPTDRRMLGLLRSLADALIVAAGTLRAERYNPVRTPDFMAGYRERAGMGPHPVLVVVTREPKIDDSYRAIAEAPVRPIVLCHHDSGALADVAEVIELPAPDGGVDLAGAKALLAERGLRRQHTEGGPHLLGSLIAAGLLDEYCLTVAARIEGGGAALRPVMGPETATLFTLQHAASADDDVYLLYRRRT